MSTIHEALLYRLSNDAGINAIIGRRIHAVKLPDNPPLPCVSYQVISTTKYHTLANDCRNHRILLQVDCWANTKPQAVALSSAVKTCLDHFRGTVSGVEILGILFQGQSDDFEDTTDCFREMQEFSVNFLE